MKLQDLNDLAYFAAVVEHGGFATAGRALGIPKSRLSRHVALLEERLGVRLLHRTTRRFAVTQTGQAFLRHCRAMLAEAQAAHDLVAAQSSAPRGTVRLSCPPALLHAAVGDMLARALKEWPHISVHVQANNRAVDVWEGGVDFALRVRAPDAQLPAEETVRPLALSPHRLVAAPALLGSTAPPQQPQDVLRLPTLGFGLGQEAEETRWLLHGPQGQQVVLTHSPRLVVDDMAALLCAARSGVGCAVLPGLLVHALLESGELVEVLPQWQPPPGVVQAVYASRRGMRPAVRALLDSLAGGFARLAALGHCLQPAQAVWGCPQDV